MIGIDGCKKGFMIARLEDSMLTFSIESDLTSLINEKDLILIDVPLGCPSSLSQHRPEPLMRPYLKKRASSVFNVPALQCFDYTQYDEVNKKNREILNKGLSRQSFGIMPIIKKVNDFILEHPYLNLHESHPELVFTWMKRSICNYSKHTPEGIQERVDTLVSMLPSIKDELIKALLTYSKSYHQDIVDSCALVICAYLIQKRGLITIPHDVQKNSQGIEMKILLFNDS
jgi:predicted RNase H-like nuclease